MFVLSTVCAFRAHNRRMERSHSSRLPLFRTLLALVSVCILAGCAGVSAGPNNQVTPPPPNPNPNPTAGTLAVSPTTLKFGNVTVGSSSSLTATLSASNADVTISSAAWNGTGYSVTGITFPVTIPAGQNAKYKVTFAPPATGSDPGSISFASDATNASLQQNFTGTGTQNPPPQHSVSLNWDPSTSLVAGYNIYRGTQSGGPYTKLNSSLLAATDFSDSGVQSGTTYFYVSTAVDGNSLESSFSNEASADVP